MGIQGCFRCFMYLRVLDLGFGGFGFKTLGLFWLLLRNKVPFKVFVRFIYISDIPQQQPSLCGFGL